MPELPEVETIKSYIEPLLINRKFQKIEILNPNLRIKIPDELPQILINQKITNISRRAKYIIIDCSNNIKVIIHLGMTGKIRAYQDKFSVNKHDHIIFSLNNKTKLIYNDVRKFGFITFEVKADIKEISFFAKLGIEPLSPEFNQKYFAKLCQKSSSEIKKFIMNQNYIVGIGNIYACEALFLSQINPQKPANSLTYKEQNLFVKNIKKILEDAISKGGSSIKDFQLVNGESGYFQNYFNVYGREKKPCKICNTDLIRIQQSGRSTFYCGLCQKN
jgi:formamidopyrimidine-DNA glycosylase